MSDGEGVAFLLIFVLAALFAAPICNWLLLGKPVYSIVPQNCNMTAIGIPNTPFPPATSEFYEKMYGMTDLSLQKDWYYSKWLMYPGVQGICPWNEAITIQCTVFDSKGVCTSYTGGIKYCFRPKSETQPDERTWVNGIWQRMDLENAAAGIKSDMVGGYTIFRQIYLSTLHLAIGCMVVYGGFPFFSCCAVIALQGWEKRHKLQPGSVIVAFLFPVATILFIIYWAYAIRLWNKARDPAANPAFTTAANWLTMFPHCESVQFIGKETSTGAVGTFSALEQTMIIFPPFLWLPSLMFCFKEADKVADTFRALFKSLLTCDGATEFDDTVSGGGDLLNYKSSDIDAKIPSAGGSSPSPARSVALELRAASALKKSIPDQYQSQAPAQNSKLAQCKADCIANQRPCVKGYENIAGLAVDHPEYTGGCACDGCGKVLSNDRMLHCNVHRIDLCVPCLRAASQDLQKIAECKVGCIANQRACMKGYDDIAALAVDHPEYAGGGSCDVCFESLNKLIVHCNDHRLDFCAPCAFSQDGQKVAECKADCIARERPHAKCYANIAALAAVHPQYALGGGCDGCATLLGNDRLVHCDVHRLDLCAKCAYPEVKAPNAGVNTANPLSSFDLELE